MGWIRGAEGGICGQKGWAPPSATRVVSCEELSIRCALSYLRRAFRSALQPVSYTHLTLPTILLV
eukprot:3120490-Pyramimonas_sp.AAC.1